MLLWHTWTAKGGPLSPGSPKTGPGQQWREILATTCSAARNVLPALEQDMPSDAPEAFLLPRECSHLTASCLGFSGCRERLVNGLDYVPCRYKEGCRGKCTEAK